MLTVCVRNHSPQLLETLTTAVTHMERNNLACFGIHRQPNPLLVLLGLHEAGHGSVLGLSLPPEHRPKQPCMSGPQVIGHPRCHRRTAMGPLVRRLDYHTAGRPTESVEAHRPPPPPAVRAP